MACVKNTGYRLASKALTVFWGKKAGMWSRCRGHGGWDEQLQEVYSLAKQGIRKGTTDSRRMNSPSQLFGQCPVRPLLEGEEENLWRVYSIVYRQIIILISRSSSKLYATTYRFPTAVKGSEPQLAGIGRISAQPSIQYAVQHSV